MLVSKQEYNKEITIDKNVIREIKDFFTGKIVIASKDISCNKAHINIQEDKEGNEITSFVSDSETVFLLKGSSIRINKIESYSEYLRFYCECCGEDGKIELVCIDKPLSSKEQSKLIFNKTLSTPISPNYQKILDDMPTPEQVVSDLFTSNLVLLRKSEEFDARQEVRKQRIKKAVTIREIIEIIGTIMSFIGGFLLAKLVPDNPPPVENMSDKAISISNSIDNIGCGIVIAVIFIFIWLGINGLLEYLSEKFVSKKNNIWHKLYKAYHGKDYADTERNADLYDTMNKEEVYNLESVSIDSIEDKKPRLLSIGKIRKEKYKNLELYRTVDKKKEKNKDKTQDMEIFSFPAFPTETDNLNDNAPIKNVK